MTDIHEQRKLYPFVTSVLKATQPEQDQSRLKQWRESITDEAAEAIRAAAQDRGNEFDTAVANYFSSGMSGNQDIDRYLKRWKVHAQEAHVFNDEFGYQGYFDFRGERDGITWLLDWKTAGKPKKRQYLTDESQQLAALYFSHDAGQLPVKAQFGMIVSAIPDGRGGWIFQEHHFNESQLREALRLFLIRLNIYKSKPKPNEQQ